MRRTQREEAALCAHWVSTQTHAARLSFSAPPGHGGSRMTTPPTVCSLLPIACLPRLQDLCEQTSPLPHKPRLKTGSSPGLGLAGFWGFLQSKSPLHTNFQVRRQLQGGGSGEPEWGLGSRAGWSGYTKDAAFTEAGSPEPWDTALCPQPEPLTPHRAHSLRARGEQAGPSIVLGQALQAQPCTWPSHSDLPLLTVKLELAPMMPELP